LLFTLKVISRLFYRHDVQWVGEVPEDGWVGNRVVAVLNHTSLYEWLWAGVPPAGFLWQTARHGVVPVAEITLQRPVVGAFFRFIARHVVSLSRERDHTWQEVLRRIDDPQALTIILPEGRMMRPNGLDKNGKPMTVRGGIADLVEAIPDGRMLVGYSGGLHHVQAPGELLPRLFKRLSIRLESIDIRQYREQMLASAGSRGFKRAVVRDMEARRDRYCFPETGRHPGGPRQDERERRPKGPADEGAATVAEAPSPEASAGDG
jgi:hypothetical protein